MAVSGVGTKFRKWDAEATTPEWVAIAEVNSISGPTMTKDFIDVTSLDSTGGYRDFISGFRDGGTISLVMNFTYDNYLIMLDDFNALAGSDEFDYEINIDDTGEAATRSTFYFRGIVTECPVEIPTDDKITNNVTIKVKGKVYLKQGESTDAPVYA